MDATHNVEATASQPASEEAMQTAKHLREEIAATGKVMQQHVEDLLQHLNHRIELLRNPFGLRDSVRERPLLACGATFVAGLVIGRMRSESVVPAIARNLWGAFGSSLVDQVAAKIFRS